MVFKIKIEKRKESFFIFYFFSDNIGQKISHISKFFEPMNVVPQT